LNRLKLKAKGSKV